MPRTIKAIRVECKNTTWEGNSGDSGDNPPPTPLGRIFEESFSKPCLRGALTTKMVGVGMIYVETLPFTHASLGVLCALSHPLSRKAPW